MENRGGGLRGVLVKNRGFRREMGVSRNLWSKIGVLVENGGFSGFTVENRGF